MAYNKRAMLSVLEDIVHNHLPILMQDKDRWRSVDVTYHAPHVERLWRTFDQYRVFLHRIHPCDVGEALFHPHPWPSAAMVVNGRYEHKIGWKKGDTAHVAETAILTAGSCYEIVRQETWHSVRPLGGPSDSIMVVGPLYDPPTKMPNPPPEKQGSLSPERFEALFAMWHDYIDRRVQCDSCGWQGRRTDLSSFEDESPYSRCPSCYDEDQVGTLTPRTA